ncbi:hypothetical protein [Noviherbaspirillum massiliense]|uniref:hypothetical protein n=1 Tax=Noviherbaspirillum massiliense TaxID=1465823 RepID=UPI000304E81C|nr:hypothetical protein [Noviherbaspirillum massiliense]
MAVKLNLEAFDHARQLLRERHVITDEHTAWHDHKPSPEQEEAFLHRHGVEEYAKWFLGIDDSEEEIGKYKFPYGDFKNVHRCGVLAVESRASEAQYYSIQIAAAELHGMIDTGQG